VPFDFAILAIVFALILLVVFFSAVVLYLSFRIKETFRKETRRGATIAKVAFLIGTLFLAGGIFYFFANTMTDTISPNPTASPSPFASPTTTPNPNTPMPSPSSSASPEPTSMPSTIPLNLNVAYPSTAKMRTEIVANFIITNPTSQTAHSAVIQTNVLFQSFTVQSTTHPIDGNVINIGDVPPGTLTITLKLLSPQRPTEVEDAVTLIYSEMATPITSEIKIEIKAN